MIARPNELSVAVQMRKGVKFFADNEDACVDIERNLWNLFDLLCSTLCCSGVVCALSVIHSRCVALMLQFRALCLRT